MQEIFRKFAQKVSHAMGTPWAFLTALILILLWVLSGPLFNFSDTWQLVINTTTTIITFLMVFLIQNTQNRDNKALNLKIDELIKANKRADNQSIDLDDLDDKDLEMLEIKFKQIARSGK